MDGSQKNRQAQKNSNKGKLIMMMWSAEIAFILISLMIALDCMQPWLATIEME